MYTGGSLNEKIIELKTELSEDQLRFHSLELRVKKIFLECFFIFTYLIIILLFYFYFKSETSNLEYCIRVIGWYELDSDYRLRYGGARIIDNKVEKIYTSNFGIEPKYFKIHIKKIQVPLKTQLISKALLNYLELTLCFSMKGKVV